ncbi:unnamed protein product [Rhizoctonia solani]|uniref:Uncharacterized protein n=1 Tax=Rhizoctonia solani TaxID=456999 RepID=A0A8H3DP30_9AGAM|nr:unnamed protein product [Rhizoctonia solani]
MDYSSPETNKTVSIFMRKLPAKSSAQQRLGSLFLNPGGPGGSGSVTVVESGEELSTILEGRYDIIGFDPRLVTLIDAIWPVTDIQAFIRGVNLTSPPTSCLDTESKFLERDYQAFLIGAPFPSKENNLKLVTHLAALQAGHHAACAKNGNQDMLRSVGTVAVAREPLRHTTSFPHTGISLLILHLTCFLWICYTVCTDPL